MRSGILLQKLCLCPNRMLKIAFSSFCACFDLVPVCLRSVCLWEQDVAKKHKKDVRFEIDVVEDLLPVDVEEGAMRGK